MLGRTVQRINHTIIAAASYAVEGEVVDPGTSARCHHNVLDYRRGAPAARQPHIDVMSLGPLGNLVWPMLGALDYSLCMSICGSTWTDALHTVHFGQLLSICVVDVWAGPFWLVAWPAVCAYA